MALYRRDGRGAGTRDRGEWLQVSMQGAALSLLAPAFASSLVSGIEIRRTASTAFSGSPLSGTFDVADGHLAIVCNADDQAVGLLAALREAGMAADAMAALEAAHGRRDVAAAQALLGQVLAAEPVAVCEERLARHGVPATRVRRAGEAAAEAAVGWPAVALPAPQGQRTVRVPGIGFESTEVLTPTVRAPARRGADTRAVLGEAGLTTAEIDAMLADGAAWEPPAG
jgi:crotonobetainyl-CoA:carnitine CoA-transferase CaiB-like acyl-CoA transferase